MAPVPDQQTHVTVPVAIKIGDTAISLGNLSVPLYALTAEERAAGKSPQPVPSSARAALANLFRTAAAVVEEKTPGRWPRQAWWVGDRMPLPGSRDHGVVVQVDTHRRRYLVDTGKTQPVPVPWGLVDPLAAVCRLDGPWVDSAVAVYGHGHE